MNPTNSVFQTRAIQTITCALGASLLVGCSQRQEPNPEPSVPENETNSSESGLNPWATVDPFESSTAVQSQFDLALNAKEHLESRLKAKLMEAIQSQGPAHAINVCKDQAPIIAQEINDELNVKIGRTSLKLRNQTNHSPEWLEAVLEQDSPNPTTFTNEQSELAAGFPIILAAPCLMCHGDPESLNPAVKEQLALNYPEDKATGYGISDLRGWIWVEVPHKD